jgi:hypothetical protein
MEAMTHQISHDDMNAEQIQKKEIEIIKTLHYDLTSPTIYNIIEMIIGIIISKHQEKFTKQNWILLKEIYDRSIYIALMACLDYDTMQHK